MPARGENLPSSLRIRVFPFKTVFAVGYSAAEHHLHRSKALPRSEFCKRLAGAFCKIRNRSWGGKPTRERGRPARTFFLQTGCEPPPLPPTVRRTCRCGVLFPKANAENRRPLRESKAERTGRAAPGPMRAGRPRSRGARPFPIINPAYWKNFAKGSLVYGFVDVNWSVNFLRDNAVQAICGAASCKGSLWAAKELTDEFCKRLFGERFNRRDSCSTDLLS